MYCVFEQLMCDRGLTPYKVAKATGITQATLSRWKTGKVSPSIETLQLLANYFGVTVDYLLGNVSDPFFHLDNERILRDINSYENLAQKEKPATPEDDELNEYLDFLKNREEGRMLFSLAKNATKEDVLRAVAVIDALRKEDERQK